MSLSIGIVGLPNVGKSTLFTALTKKTGLAANYPFATIDPNVGIVDVPDSRLQKLADIVNPGRIVPATVEFVDIAGLVKGANEGEGLGNQFLANIRETDAICEVVRYFKDPNVMREVGRTGEFVDPAGDADTIMTELILADMGTLEKQLPKLEKEAKRDKELMPKFEVAKRLLAWLNEGKRAASMEMTDEERAAAKGLFLLTMKPILYVANVDEDMLNEDLAPIDGVKPLPICANIDLYTGFIYKMLGVPETLFTPLFAVARMAGWSAHRMEELFCAHRIIRPAYRPVIEPLEYKPLADR